MFGVAVCVAVSLVTPASFTSPSALLLLLFVLLLLDFDALLLRDIGMCTFLRQLERT